MTTSISSTLAQTLTDSMKNSNRSREKTNEWLPISLQNTEETSAKETGAVKLNLSRQAEALLQQLTAGAAKQEGYPLSEVQEKVLTTLLEKYQDVPITEENYAALLDDLEAHNLSPERLTMQEKISSFDATQSFLDAMNGKQVSIKELAAPYTQVDEERADDYLAGIVARWEELRTASLTEEEAAS